MLALEQSAKQCNSHTHLSQHVYYDPDRREGALSVSFARPSVRLSVRLSVYVNPSRTARIIREENPHMQAAAT